MFTAACLLAGFALGGVVAWRVRSAEVRRLRAENVELRERLAAKEEAHLLTWLGGLDSRRKADDTPIPADDWRDSEGFPDDSVRWGEVDNSEGK